MGDVVLKNPFKLLIKHLKIATKKDDQNSWIVEINANVNNLTVSKKIEFNTIWIQTTLDQNTSNEIFLVSDETGKAKITNCKAAAAIDMNWTKGMYCNVIGILVRVKGIPEIQAQQIIPICEKERITLLKRIWPIEVQDSHLFLLDVMHPNLNED